MSDDVRVITPLTGNLDADGFYARVELADGTEVALAPRLLGAVALTAGPASGWTGWADEWMFEHLTAALFAWASYCTDPAAPIDGWVRHVSSGTPTVRRRPCADCGRILEYGDDEDGVAEPVPTCSHDDTLD